VIRNWNKNRILNRFIINKIILNIVYKLKSRSAIEYIFFIVKIDLYIMLRIKTGIIYLKPIK